MLKNDADYLACVWHDDSLISLIIKYMIKDIPLKTKNSYSCETIKLGLTPKSCIFGTQKYYFNNNLQWISKKWLISCSDYQSRLLCALHYDTTIDLQQIFAMYPHFWVLPKCSYIGDIIKLHYDIITQLWV